MVKWQKSAKIMYFINVLKNVFEQFRIFSGPALENDRFVREEH